MYGPNIKQIQNQTSFGLYRIVVRFFSLLIFFLCRCLMMVDWSIEHWINFSLFSNHHPLIFFAYIAKWWNLSSFFSFSDNDDDEFDSFRRVFYSFWIYKIFSLLFCLSSSNRNKWMNSMFFFYSISNNSIPITHTHTNILLFYRIFSYLETKIFSCFDQNWMLDHHRHHFISLPCRCSMQSHTRCEFINLALFCQMFLYMCVCFVCLFVCFSCFVFCFHIQ